MNRSKPLRRTAFKPKAKLMKRTAMKTKAPKKRETSALTENARGKECTLRLPGCLPGNETVVFAHYRRFGWGGTSLKPVDLLGCFACASCHDKQERHHPDCTDGDLLRAMGETLMQQLSDGVIATI